ncbi:class I SAM-dependent methyltransferase [Nitrospira sp. Nam74]
MEAATCVLCLEPKFTEQLTRSDINLGKTDEVFTIVRCDGCGLLYLNPRPTADEIHTYYPPQYYPLGGTVQRKAIDRIIKRFSRALKKAIREEFYGYPVSSHAPFRSLVRRILLYPEYLHLKFAGRESTPYRGEGRILDVGCGAGKLLSDLREHGWQVYGVDFSPVAANYARSQHGLDVRLGDLFQAGYEDGFFDVVMFNHSLEHIYNPLEMLKEAHRIMKPGGLLFISIPNAGGLEARLFGKWWVHWDTPRHLYHFNKTTMSRLVTDAGFRLGTIKSGVGTTFFLGSVDAVYKHLLHRQKGHGILMKHLIARPLCLLAGHLGYGTEMKVYAEKAG